MKSFIYALSVLYWLPLCMHKVLITQKGWSIWFDKPNNLDGRASWYAPTADKSWESNSLPIGNGSLGGNILGSVTAERITLNEKTLWRGGPNTEKGADYYWNVNKESAHLLPEIRQAFVEGNQKKQKSLPAAISTDWQITNPAAKLRSVSVLTPVWEKHTLKQD